MPKQTPRYTEYVPVDDLRPDPRNPKRHADEDIDESFRRFGYTEPVTVDERTGLLITGHGRRERLLAAREAGQEPPDGVLVTDGQWTVPVLRGWSSRDDDEAAAYLVAANQITVKGGWHVDPLLDILDRLRDQTEGLLGLGYSDVEVDDLLRETGRLADRHGAFLDDLTSPVGSPPGRPMHADNIGVLQSAELALPMTTEERDEAITLLRGFQKTMETDTLAHTLLTVLRSFVLVQVAGE